MILNTKLKRNCFEFDCMNYDSKYYIIVMKELLILIKNSDSVYDSKYTGTVIQNNYIYLMTN